MKYKKNYKMYKILKLSNYINDYIIKNILLYLQKKWEQIF